MLTISFLNISGDEAIADYDVRVRVNGHEIARETITRHTRAHGWRALVWKLGEDRKVNHLQHQLLDLITLMPDRQTDEIVTYIQQLRAARKNIRLARPPDDAA